VRAGEVSLSYAELNAQANQWAHALRHRGVSLGSPVALMLERSVEMVVAMLAVLKVGGCYVPLDPSHPPSRLAFICQDTQAQLLVTHSRWLPTCAVDGLPTLCMDQEQVAVRQQWPEDNPETFTDAESLAYVIYTSGSTGQPKGVCVLHRGIMRLVKGNNYLSVKAHQRMAHVSNVAFDAATFEIWGALLNAAELVVMDKALTLDPQQFSTALESQKVDHLFVTTALFNQVANQCAAGFGSVQTLLFGGEQCDPASIRKVLAAAAPQRLLHVYGPTENTTFSSWFEIHDLAEDAVTVPIGQAISNTTLYVLDEAGGIQAPGVVGELYVGGEGLAQGI